MAYVSESRTNILPGILSLLTRKHWTSHQIHRRRAKKTPRTELCHLACRQWLLVPTQTSPQGEPDWKAFRLSGQDSLAVRASKKLRIDAVSAEVLPRNASAEMMFAGSTIFLATTAIGLCASTTTQRLVRVGVPRLEFSLFEALLTGRFIAFMERTSSHEKPKSPAELKL